MKHASRGPLPPASLSCVEGPTPPPLGLPFMSRKQVQKMQTAMHLSLRLTFQFHSSPHLLLLEVGDYPWRHSTPKCWRHSGVPVWHIGNVSPPPALLQSPFRTLPEARNPSFNSVCKWMQNSSGNSYFDCDVGIPKFHCHKCLPVGIPTCAMFKFKIGSHQVRISKSRSGAGTPLHLVSCQFSWSIDWLLSGLSPLDCPGFISCILGLHSPSVLVSTLKDLKSLT